MGSTSFQAFMLLIKAFVWATVHGIQSSKEIRPHSVYEQQFYFILVQIHGVLEFMNCSTCVGSKTFS